MHGYSDRVSHALAFCAKYYGGGAPRGAGVAYLAHPSNVALILARYGAEQLTVVAGILHHLLEEAPPARRGEVERRIGEKFGAVVLAVARDAVEPKYDDRGERPWRAAKCDFLTHLAIAEPRALDIIAAEEIQSIGTTMAALRRLGVEYLRTVSRASSEQTVWWYRSMLEILDRRPEWPHREMLEELRVMSTDLVRSLRQSEEEL